jgi:hypothetical protein
MCETLKARSVKMEQRYNQLIFVLYQSSQKEQPRQQTINMNKRWKINSRKMFLKAHRKILAKRLKVLKPV